ncbi:hypothetical protein K503DRAFT_748458 [Rhizopogon vinicolor AM-OR11-026]|uniref:DUF6534 domain-containing protein n=1 Tax=Rhizopogon vinicolor AM-OR11-026 TaxID=1314800 RepID=A0A1B7MM39_9AGAM|nr:hypothetical protein K503DRAFT_748458 [Rhizopogon vinicolor AM-OR11-026]
MSSLTQNFSLHLDLGKTFGALFIGVTFSSVLFGVTNVQTFIYFQTRMHRSTGMTLHKSVVIWLRILDAVHLALITHCVYYYLVANYANLIVLTEIVWSFKLQIVIDVLIVYTVHVMYVYRIWIVSKNRSRVLPTIVAIIVILGSGVGMVLIWAIYRCHVFSDLIGIQWATYMTLSTVAFIDFIIASSLCYILATSRTGFSSTDSLLTNLMAYTINTGCLTSIFSMAGIIMCAVMPKNFIFLGIEFLMVKLYVNSYLALLNARYYLQPNNSDTIQSSEHHIHHGVYHQELHSNMSQDRNFQSSRTNIFKHPDEDSLHATRYVQAVKRPIAVMMEMSSFSSV